MRHPEALLAAFPSLLYCPCPWACASPPLPEGARQCAPTLLYYPRPCGHALFLYCRKALAAFPAYVPPPLPFYSLYFGLLGENAYLEVCLLLFYSLAKLS